MRKLTQIAMVVMLLLFVGAVAHVNGRQRLIAQETLTCASTYTGEPCGTRTVCLQYVLTSGGISKDGANAGVTCKDEIKITLYRYVPPPSCMQCHGGSQGGGTTGGGSSGGGSSGGGGGGSTPGEDCGDPDMWSDDGASCDRETQSS